MLVEAIAGVEKSRVEVDYMKYARPHISPQHAVRNEYNILPTPPATLNNAVRALKKKIPSNNIHVVLNLCYTLTVFQKMYKHVLVFDLHHLQFGYIAQIQLRIMIQTFLS